MEISWNCWGNFNKVNPKKICPILRTNLSLILIGKFLGTQMCTLQLFFLIYTPKNFTKKISKIKPFKEP